MYCTEDISGIREFMLSNNHTLGVAESVTSGHLQAAISLANEASNFFQGGITVYNLGQKSRHLHVNPIHAGNCNCVSHTVADEMARHAIEFFSCDWSIAITGYASPVPEMGIHDLFAYYTICFRGNVIHRAKVECENLGTLRVQLHFTNEVLKVFLESVLLKSTGIAKVKSTS